MLKRFIRLVGGDPNKKVIGQYAESVDQINELEETFERLSDEALKAKTTEFRERLANGDTLDELLAEAFTAVREASKRWVGLRHYDVQLIGGIALHRGNIAEMRTGEGKTLVATLPLYLNALTGKGTHLVTVNDYLARRDARWMAPIYNGLGLSVGVLQMAARTENGKKAFLVDLEKESPHEDQHQLRMAPRQDAYAADITYGTNSEFGFDYLRDNMTYRLDDRVQRGHYYAIVDEVDNVLIDEARTPLIISGPAQDDTEWYVRMAQVVKRLRPEDYEINEHDRTITLTEVGESHVEEVLEMPLRDPDRPEDVTLEQARLMGYLEQGLRAQFLFKRNKDYLVQAGKVIIIDEFTGRLMPGRRWSDGLHQAVEAKEGARVQAENITYATITIQNYFRMYEKLSGMTGTALTESEEFHKIYKLEVVAIPTNLEYRAAMPDSDLEELEGKDEAGYKFRYYVKKDPAGQPARSVLSRRGEWLAKSASSGQPDYWKRKDYPDIIYRSEESKFRAITEEILRYHTQGRPMLVGTTSVELSDRLSNRLRAEPIRRLTQVSLIRQTWMEKHEREEDGRQIPELEALNQSLDLLQASELRKMANEVGISLNPEDAGNLDRLLAILELRDEDRPRLMAILKAGIPHQVLNARKHTEESQIIAEAGAFGAVTIATNMAGRGVDIVLGGFPNSETLYNTARVIKRALINSSQGDELTDEIEALSTHLYQGVEALGYGAKSIIDRLVGLRKRIPELSAEEVGIYQARMAEFDEYIADLEKIRALGGLHVIGSERHEARRIDNQLRGRSARQGDPGSSRFYLSMEDELMRRFGGQQANDLMQRLKIDDAIPLEMGLVSRLVEQSQTRVEGANFDMRKHLLEYDDVLNAQRSRIYDQRERIFKKEDLSEDVSEMLRTEVKQRVPQALKDEEGPWKLLAWLEGIQPTLQLDRVLFPSYMMKLMVDDLMSQELSQENPLRALLNVAQGALEAEERHLLHALQTSLGQARERLESTLNERIEALDNFIDGLTMEETGDDGEPVRRSTRELAEELNSLLHIQVRLTPEQQRALANPSNREGLANLSQELRAQLEAAVVNQSANRVIGSMERRLDDSLDLEAGQLTLEDWDTVAEAITAAVQAALEKHRQRLLGDETPGSSQIAKDLESPIGRMSKPLSITDWTGLLLMMTQGARAAYDKKTHRRMFLRTTRLTYPFYAARLLEHQEPDEIAEEVLVHLEQAQAAIHKAWGLAEWERIATRRLPELGQGVQDGLAQALGEQKAEWLQNAPLQSLDPQDAIAAIEELGRQALTESYRPLLLSVITDLWVDYLTQMEALRVSIGLEAYAQRDPLVQYKSRASELFQTLFSNMRLGIVNRMFNIRPRAASSGQAQSKRAKEMAETAGSGEGIHLTEEIELPAGGETAGANGVAQENEVAEDIEEPVMERSGEDETARRGEPPKSKSQAPKPDGSSNQSKSKKRRRGRH